MSEEKFDRWPASINDSDFGVYHPRRMEFLDLWSEGEWAIKAYGIQSRPVDDDAAMIDKDLVQAAREHVLQSLGLTQEEGAFYKTGFAVLHEGAMANWLLFQWWTHQDVWCQLLSYSNSDDPLNFVHSTGPVRACVYETAIHVRAPPVPGPTLPVGTRKEHWPLADPAKAIGSADDMMAVFKASRDEIQHRVEDLIRRLESERAEYR